MKIKNVYDALKDGDNIRINIDTYITGANFHKESFVKVSTDFLEDVSKVIKELTDIVKDKDI